MGPRALGVQVSLGIYTYMRAHGELERGVLDHQRVALTLDTGCWQ